MKEYPKKDDYNLFKRISKKERNTIGELEEFLDFRYKFKPKASKPLKYGKFFIPFFRYYNIVDLSAHSFEFNWANISPFISRYRKEIILLKESINIKDFYLYRFQEDTYNTCCEDMAGILFKNKQEKMIFILKHVEIIDSMNREQL